MFHHFFCGFPFLKSELEEDYIWALTCLKAIFQDIKYPSVLPADRELALMNAIVKVFPGSQNLLCIWHIEKNILAKCKNKFETTEKFKEFLTHWNAVIYSDSESSYYNNLLELYSKWGEEHVAIRYIRDTWLIHKEKFVAFWADKHFHINSKVTSRVEGQNGVLKRYLNISTGDISSVRQKLELAIVNQHKEYECKVASDKIIYPHFTNNPLYKHIKGKVSRYALQFINDEILKLSTVDQYIPCTNTKITTM
jgi:hypothetical protein